MLKRTLLLATVMAVPVVAEAQRGGRGGGLGPGHGPGFGQGSHRAARIASRIGQAANNLAIESRMIAQRAQANGAVARAAKFRNLGITARQVAIEYNRSIVPVLQSRANINRKKNLVKATRPLFVKLDTAVSSILLMPFDVTNLYKDIKEDQTKLRTVLFGGNGGRPDVGQWTGSCTVVLETAWGQDIRKFYGTSFAPTRAMATQQAKISALQQCNSRLGGWMKCTVSNSCGAARR
jgi:hypothetical protein